MRPTLALLCVLAAALVSTASAEPVRVVTRDIEPFSFEQSGQRTGFAMELWDNVARELKLDYTVTVVPTAKDMVAAVQNKTADVGVGALSITSEREKVIDFSQPFYESGLQIAVSKKPSSILDTAWGVLRNFFTWQVAVGLAIALAVMFVISHLVWLYEHPVNEEMWPRSYLAGMGESFWWTISIFLVGGADNKGPVGFGGRLVATVWMLASVIAVSLLTALLSAAFTVNSLTTDIGGPSDLPGKKVATIAGSTAETWLGNLQNAGGEKTDVTAFKTVPECLAALKAGKVKAVVYDAPVLQYYVNKAGSDDFTLVDGLFDANNYGFALELGSPLRKQINQVLLKLNENGVIDKLRKDYFGQKQ
jgi:ABC-type amino acid transport substrate-binding protein